MLISKLTLALAAVAALSLGACSTSGEQLSGAGAGIVVGGAVAGPVGAVAGGIAGAVEGPTVAGEMGVPHRHWRHRHWRHHHYVNNNSATGK